MVAGHPEEANPECEAAGNFVGGEQPWEPQTGCEKMTELDRQENVSEAMNDHAAEYMGETHPQSYSHETGSIPSDSTSEPAPHLGEYDIQTWDSGMNSFSFPFSHPVGLPSIFLLAFPRSRE